jgi:hypothetical protein
MVDINSLLPKPRPLTGVVAIYGDSRVQYGNDGPPSKDHHSWAAWIEALMLGAVSIPFSCIFGYPSQNTSYILTQLASVLACPAEMVIYLASTNDRSDGLTAAQTIANYDATMRAIPAAGKRLIMLTDLPRGISGGVAGFTGTPLANHQYVRRWLLANRNNYPGVTVLDTWPRFVDPADSTSKAKAGLLYDGAHMNAAGAFALANDVIVPHLSRVYAPINILPASNADVWDASLNLNGSLNANPMCLGTAGTLGGGATGIVADGLQVVGATGATVVASKQVDADGTEWQRIVCSGTPTGTIQIRNVFSNTSPGDNVVSKARIRVSGVTQPYETVALINDTTIGGVSVSNRFLKDTTSDYQVSMTYDGYYLTEPALIGSGTVTVSRSTLAVYPIFSATAGITVDVRAWETVKV